MGTMGKLKYCQQLSNRCHFSGCDVVGLASSFPTLCEQEVLLGNMYHPTHTILSLDLH